MYSFRKFFFQKNFLFSGFLRKTPKQDAVYINGKFIPKPIPVKIVDLTSPDFLSYKNYSSLYLAYHDLSVSKDRFYKLRKVRVALDESRATRTRLRASACSADSQQ